MRRGSASRGGPPSSRCAWASPSGPSSGWTTASSPCSSGCWRSGWLLSKLLAAALLIIGADGLDFEAFGTAGGAMRAPPLYIAALGIVEWFIELPGGPLLMAVACSPPLLWGLRLWMSKKKIPPHPTSSLPSSVLTRCSFQSRYLFLHALIFFTTRTSSAPPPPASGPIFFTIPLFVFAISYLFLQPGGRRRSPAVFFCNPFFVFAIPYFLF